VRSSVEVLQLPYTFTQQKLLTPHAFAHEFHGRGTPVTTQHLEQLHRARMLFPLFRVSTTGARLPRPYGKVNATMHVSLGI
jgi:hypothetical protein